MFGAARRYQGTAEQANCEMNGMSTHDTSTASGQVSERSPGYNCKKVPSRAS